MNDETKSAGTGPEDSPEIQLHCDPGSAGTLAGAAQPDEPAGSGADAPRDSRVGERPPAYWLKGFLVCNPFYLASAALLLFGLYRVSVDPHFLSAETAQLTFNFSSLQCYELLLVGTGIVLAARRIFYDSTLLVVLENLFVLVPFMLISQAALVEQRVGRWLCAVAALLVIARTLATRRWIGSLNFSPRLLATGLGVLLVNSAWPVIYRFFQETKVGKKMTSGAAYEMNELSWFWLLPALCALAFLLPRPRADGKSPASGRWFPVTLFSLWLLGSGMHLYALGYIYDYDLRPEHLAPALWVLAWVMHLRLPDYVESLAPGLRQLTLALPLPVTLLAANTTGSNVFFALNLVNVLAFVWLVKTECGQRLALHLAMLSYAAAVAALPVPSFHHLATWLNRTDLIGLGALGYVMTATFLTRNPRIAVAGSLAAAWLIGLLRGAHGDTLHWAAQFGVVFFLLHSLRWRDHELQGAAAMRAVLAAGWVVHTFFWLHDGAAFWNPLATASVILLAWSFRGIAFQRWAPVVVPVAAACVALCSPANFALSKLQSAPVGVMAILGSFLLFAAGTALALTKHRWHRNEVN